MDEGRFFNANISHTSFAEKNPTVYVCSSVPHQGAIGGETQRGDKKAVRNLYILLQLAYVPGCDTFPNSRFAVVPGSDHL